MRVCVLIRRLKTPSGRFLRPAVECVFHEPTNEDFEDLESFFEFKAQDYIRRVTIEHLTYKEAIWEIEIVSTKEP